MEKWSYKRFLIRIAITTKWLVLVGSKNIEFMVAPCIWMDIKDSKIWIQWNATDLDIAQKLVHLGISPQDIVIGFHPVNLRQYSDYAVC
jgi:XisI protein